MKLTKYLPAILLIMFVILGAVLYAVLPAVGGIGIFMTGIAIAPVAGSEGFDDVLKAVNEKISGTVKDLSNKYEEAIKSSVTKLDLDNKLASLTKEINELSEIGKQSVVKSLNEINEKLNKTEDALKAQGLVIESFKQRGENSPKKERTTFKDALYSAIKSEKVTGVRKSDFGNDDIETLKFTPGIGMKLQVQIPNGADLIARKKAAVDMTAALALSGVNTGYLTQYDSEISSIPLTTNIHALNIFPVVPINSKYYGVIVEYTYWDGSATKAEGSASGKSSVLLKTVEFKVFTISTYAHISKENIEDLPNFVDELNILMPDKILSKIDSKIFVATGDNSADIKGFFHADHQAVFVPSTYSGKVTDCNIIDVIVAAKTQATKSDYIPNFVVLNKDAIWEIGQIKDKNDNSIMDRRVNFVNGVPTMIAGMTIVNNDSVTANQAYMGDVRAARIGLRRDMTMTISDSDSTDFVEGMVKVMFDIRLAAANRAKNAFCFVSDIAAAITTMDSGS